MSVSLYGYCGCQVILEPVIADRLYGGILERIAEEVAKMENEKLDDEGVYEVMQ